ncbi:MAG: membrane protein insertion efficiency factor YidD [Desulfobacteraceae bacterium]|nr:membrane protein insertion efficiency factor YidD [Desulfobacteraceae bacterium]
MINFCRKLYYAAKKYIKRDSCGIGGVLLLGFVLAGPGCAIAPNAGKAANSKTGPFDMAVRIYRGPLDHLDSVRTGQCPMFPSCSHYAQEAIKKHGPVTGIMLASDRLIRCGRGELEYAQKIAVNGKWSYYDPLSVNDFWFYFTPKKSSSVFPRHPDFDAY